MKWWGWGDPSIRYGLEKRPASLSFIQDKMGIQHWKSSLGHDMSTLIVSDSRLPKSILDEFRSHLGQEICSVHRDDRISHACGKSYKDLIRVRKGGIENPPDLVLYPRNEDHIWKIFELCQKYQIAVIPFGGGTSVVGGVEPRRGQMKYVATLDVTFLNQVLEIDSISHTATVQAGIFGPQLEKILNQSGFTLGHFPQSFEYSTLGGWIATRSSGQNSAGYGGIERLVVSVRMVAPTGQVHTLNCPRRADGPDLKELILGSEGICGVIVSATVRITPSPEDKLYVGILFKNFQESTSAARDLTQNKITFSMLRVSDEDETEALAGANLKSGLIRLYLKLKGFDLSKASLMLIGFEGSRKMNRWALNQAKGILSHYAHVMLGKSAAGKWLEERFRLPYLRDELLDNDILVDTLETATVWSNLGNLYTSVKAALSNACCHYSNRIWVMTHLSHLYPDGASLYFTVMTPQKRGSELEQWEEMKGVASQAIVKNGGVISHHHGIGEDHKPYLGWNDTERKVICDLKKSLDPDGILNPEKIV